RRGEERHATGRSLRPGRSGRRGANPRTARLPSSPPVRLRRPGSGPLPPPPFESVPADALRKVRVAGAPGDPRRAYRSGGTPPRRGTEPPRSGTGRGRRVPRRFRTGARASRCRRGAPVGVGLLVGGAGQA